MIKSPVVIVDDVVTSGMSALDAASAIREAGFECMCIMSIIFRGTSKQREEIEESIRLEPIFYQDQLVEQFKEMRS